MRMKLFHAQGAKEKGDLIMKLSSDSFLLVKKYGVFND